jgi:hypothetical protein
LHEPGVRQIFVVILPESVGIQSDVAELSQILVVGGAELRRARLERISVLLRPKRD